MNTQKLFEQGATHLLTQKKRAIIGPDCQYRASDGTKCAFGCFILDEEYTPNMEGYACDRNIFGPILTRLGAKFDKSGLEDTSYLYGDDVRFFKQLQNIHDGVEPSEWERELRWMAEQRGLDTKFMGAIAQETKK